MGIRWVSGGYPVEFLRISSGFQWRFQQRQDGSIESRPRHDGARWVVIQMSARISRNRRFFSVGHLRECIPRAQTRCWGGPIENQEGPALAAQLTSRSDRVLLAGRCTP